MKFEMIIMKHITYDALLTKESKSGRNRSKNLTIMLSGFSLHNLINYFYISQIKLDEKTAFSSNRIIFVGYRAIGFQYVFIIRCCSAVVYTYLFTYVLLVTF